MKKDWLEFQKKYRLDNSLYNFVIRPGELERKGASKTFDAKWKKPIIERPVFR